MGLLLIRGMWWEQLGGGLIRVLLRKVRGGGGGDGNKGRAHCDNVDLKPSTCCFP